MLRFMVLLHPSVVHKYYIMSEATPTVSQPESLVKSLSQQIMGSNLGFERILKRDFILSVSFFFFIDIKNQQSFLKKKFLSLLIFNTFCSYSSVIFITLCFSLVCLGFCTILIIVFSECIWMLYKMTWKTSVTCCSFILSPGRAPAVLCFCKTFVLGCVLGFFKAIYVWL